MTGSMRLSQLRRLRLLAIESFTDQSLIIVCYLCCHFAL